MASGSRPARRRGPRDLDPHLPAACGRMLRREAERLGCARTSRSTTGRPGAAREAEPGRARGIRSASSRAVSTRRSRTRRTSSSTPAMYRARVASFYDQTVAEVYERYQRRLHASNAVDFDDMLILTVEVLERFPRRASAGRRRSATCSSTSTRTRTTPSTGCCSSWPRSTRTFVPWAIRTSPSTPSEAPTSATSSSSSGTSRHPDDRARAELPLDERHPRGGERVISHNGERKEKASGRSSGGRAGARGRGGGRGPEARYVAAEIAGLVEEGYSGNEIAVFYRMNAQSRVLEETLRLAGIDYRSSAGRASTSGPRSRTRSRTCR